MSAVPASATSYVAVNPASRRPAPRGDRLTRGQLWGVIGAILALHLALGWGLLQVDAVRSAVLEAVPMFVNIVAPETPPKPEPPPPPPPPPPPRPIPLKPPPQTPIIAAETTTPPEPSAFVAEPPPPEPPPPVQAPVEPVAAAPAKIIPPSSIEYAEQPRLPNYPRQSVRLKETGTVTVRIFIDQSGALRDVTLGKSSGFPRLDDSALAVVRTYRFKPPTENGKPISGYAFIPVIFDLEK
jgi:protein TonB